MDSCKFGCFGVARGLRFAPLELEAGLIRVSASDLREMFVESECSYHLEKDLRQCKSSPPCYFIRGLDWMLI